jgi:hypothetical protein
MSEISGFLAFEEKKAANFGEGATQEFGYD